MEKKEAMNSAKGNNSKTLSSNTHCSLAASCL